MKKILLLVSIVFLNIGIGFCQTTATDFTANDCSGVSHHLFSELDAGKVIVASFVDPCSACIGPTATAINAMQIYSVTNPATVLFYLVDDYGNTPCPTLTSWAAHNLLNGYDKAFSDASFIMSQYGLPAMPKIIVIGGPNHHIYLNVEGAVTDSNQIQSAINAALAATFVPQLQNEGFNMQVYPNPAVNNISFSYTLNQTSDISIEVYNLIGSKVYSVSKEKQAPGNHDMPIAIGNNLSNGIYFIKLIAGASSNVLKFIVEK